MQPGDFSFDLPGDLIAQEPAPERGASRLLHLQADGELADLRFGDLDRILAPGDLLVLNDTRVVRARLFGRKESGGRVELLLERQLDARRALAQIKSSKSPKIGTQVEFDGGAQARIEDRRDGFFLLQFSCDIGPLLANQGHVPLPPYIRRPDVPADSQRYQTVYARVGGAVAAPTAGLHFDRPHLERLRSCGVDIGFLTLHVGAGTFQPLRAEQLARGELHAERLIVSPRLCEQVAAARARGARVVAVGTTVMRGLETAANGSGIQPFEGETRLFIRPGYRFRVADALLTNFHLPESSLLMLVCAFAGTERVLAAYRHAVNRCYRFFSYGDAMFCHRYGA